jgi:hypothetical protein
MGGNIDPRQLQELPVNGRNWMDLVMLAPGSRLNSVIEAPSRFGAAGGAKTGGDYAVNVDGQQQNALITGSQNAGQPRFSRDVIAEFEFLSGRFDATQGRSSGLQVNAITKSGTNTPSGTFSGYFRHDRFNAADFVAKRVLPYQNQQLSSTFGGPIRKDKVHVFAHFEYEREPRTVLFTTPYPSFNVDIHPIRTEKRGGVRLDAQFSSRTRLAVRSTLWRLETPVRESGSATSTPANLSGSRRRSDPFLATLTQVLSNRAVNEVKVGYASFHDDSPLYLKRIGGVDGPVVELRGLSIGADQSLDRQGQKVYSIRDDFTYSFTKGGRHTLKLGAEYLHQQVYDFRCVRCEGELDATNGLIPTNIESLFPNILDASTWNLAPLSPISIRWRQAFQTKFLFEVPRYSTGVWVQDDWTLSPRLTLNLGLRYDLELNAFANDVEILPFLPGNRPNDPNNVGPRLGFSFSLTERTVMRGGYGVYFGTVTTAKDAVYKSHFVLHATENDGRPDFASNPYNGPAPSYESLRARLCTLGLEPGCVRPEILTGGSIFAPTFQMPYSHQSSIGLQRQVGNTMVIEADYVYNGNRGHPSDMAINLSYNPATGANYPFSDISKRPYPHWGFVYQTTDGAWANTHSLQTALTRRFSNGWQASGTYTLSGLWHAWARPLTGGVEPVPFKTAPDMGGEYTLGVGDQRHRAVFNGIWQLRYGIQLSGLYFFGSGERYNTSWGTDLRRIGSSGGNERRLRPDGTIVPRNSLVGKPIHRVDLRVQRGFPLGGLAGIDGLLEMYNVFNHANYGSYTTTEVSRNYGEPSQNSNIAYASRTLQLGFRFAF